MPQVTQNTTYVHVPVKTTIAHSNRFHTHKASGRGGVGEQKERPFLQCHLLFPSVQRTGEGKDSSLNAEVCKNSFLNADVCEELGKDRGMYKQVINHQYSESQLKEKTPPMAANCCD